MIDLEREKVLTMGQAREHLPRRRGKSPAATTVWRWIVMGYRGVKLDGLRTPAGWLTSVETIGRFMTALADLDRRGKTRDVAAEAEERKQRATWADSVLDAAGVGKSRRKG